MFEPAARGPVAAVDGKSKLKSHIGIASAKDRHALRSLCRKMSGFTTLTVWFQDGPAGWSERSDGRQEGADGLMRPGANEIASPRPTPVSVPAVPYALTDRLTGVQKII